MVTVWKLPSPELKNLLIYIICTWTIVFVVIITMFLLYEAYEVICNDEQSSEETEDFTSQLEKKHLANKSTGFR